MTYFADVNELALGIFAIVVGVTLLVTYFASKRVSNATDFWAAGRGLTGVQNGFAIAGDYMSAASFLGIAGLIFLFGFDGFLYSVGFLVAFLTVLFLLGERMRNSGKYTIADVLSFRMKQRPARAAAALGTLAVAGFYLIAQMVGAGVLINALVGIGFELAVVITGAFMIIYIVAGGMLATSWVQIIKAVLLMTATTVLTLFVLGKVGWNPVDLFREARAESPDGEAYLKPGLFLSSPIDTVSLGIALVLGTAGLPHILMRFFTVPDAKAARSSVMWAVALIGAFYVMTTALGFGARAILGEGATEAVGTGGNLAAPLLAEEVGGGAGTVGGDLFLAIIAAVAFATILAVVAGLVISASGAVAHDVWSNIVRSGRDSEKEEVWVAKIAAFAIGAIAIAIAVIGGEGLNVSFMVGLAFAVAASAIFPALLLALTWRRFNTSGAVTGVLVGVFTSIALVIISPTVWPGPDSEGGLLSWYDLANPGIISVPLGFIGCWLGTVLTREEVAARSFDELYVRSETGLGAETGTGLTLTGRRGAPRTAATAATTTIPHP
ncbi:MAG TPA: sodium/solute symporter [Thermoleophilaceae bacterium]|nr:sodium/solute symporter [Thermoleophilaceae bacterium]